MTTQQEKKILDAIRMLSTAERNFVLDIIMDCLKDRQNKPDLKLIFGNGKN